MNLRLDGSEAVEALFGFWPSFHDAEILRIEIDRNGPRVAADLLAPVQPGSRRHVVVRLVFHEVEDLTLNGFNYQNVIWSLALEVSSEERIKVTFEPTFGAGCSFSCARGEVLVTPTDLRTGAAGQPDASSSDS